MVISKLKEKKNLLALSVFAIIMFSMSMKIIFIIILIILIFVVFIFLKWLFGIPLYYISKNKEEAVKKIMNKIVHILIGSFMLFLVFVQYSSNKYIRTKKINIDNMNIETEYTHETNIHSDLNSCQSLRARHQSCVSRSIRGLQCFSGTDFVLPERCRY